MKELGPLSYFLGLEVSPCSNGYYLSQVKYASNLLPQSGITDSATSPTPLDPNVRLTLFDGVSCEDVRYWQLVGSFIYLTITRLDIANVVRIASQLMAAPRSIHFIVVLCILRNVKNDCHSVRHHLQSSTLTLHFIFTTEQPADIFTKASP